MSQYEKLVRDKIPEILEEKNVPYEQRTALPEEYKQELIKKLGEEVAEFSEVGEVRELADVIEVVEALKKLPDYAEVEKLRLDKLKERGGFKNKIILEES